MTFQLNKVDEFLLLFDENKEKIRNQKGCQRLELIQDIGCDDIFFTYSYWQDEESLENYKNTDVFKFIWPKTKALFSEKPEAWSTKQIHVLD